MKSSSVSAAAGFTRGPGVFTTWNTTRRPRRASTTRPVNPWCSVTTDSEETVRNRLEVYKGQTRPLVDFLQQYVRRWRTCVPTAYPASAR